jgi:hypothetical protein
MCTICVKTWRARTELVQLEQTLHARKRWTKMMKLIKRRDVDKRKKNQKTLLAVKLQKFSPENKCTNRKAQLKMP